MATTVGSHSVSAFATPVNGGPLDANVVRGNDNTIRTAYVAHDADTGIHVQSSTLASRPSAGTAGRKWITADTGSYKLWYDDGTTWHEVAAGNIDVFVLAGEALVKGDVVKVTGYNNGTGAPIVAKMASASDTAFGIVNSTSIANGATGYITNTGLIQDVATNAFSVGDILYPNTSGGFTATKPTSGNYQPIAFVLRSNANNGVLYVEFSAPRIVERSDNTASTIVLRDASGNFSAGTITAGAVTSTGLVTFASLKGTGATTVTNILDEDNMASDSATALATQQSIKAYVDAQVATVDTLAEVLANGNTTGANDIIVSTGQKIRTPAIAAGDGTASATIANSTGVMTIASSVLTTTDINGGTIDGTTIGGSSAAAGTFTTVAATTGNITTVNATTVDTTSIEVTNVKAKDGTASITIADSTGALTLSSALADSNLATISTAGKVANSATTATSANTNSAIVARDSSGNFSAGTITANLTGNISGTAPAGTLTGTTLASNVVSSSLTSVGTLTSLTVSGNLTVDTNTLLVDSSGNFVGIGTTPDSKLHVVSGSGSTLAQLRIGFNNTSVNYYDANTHYFRDGSGPTDRMILDASGNLAVDTNTLYVDATNNLVGIGIATPNGWVDGDRGAVLYPSTTGRTALTLAGTQTSANEILGRLMFTDTATTNTNKRLVMIDGVRGADANSGYLQFSTASSGAPAVRMTLDASGNLGLGVTPSAWGASYKALQVNNVGLMANAGTADGMWLMTNAFFDGSDYKYLASDFASMYNSGNGEHRWLTAASGTAGNTITFTQAMTLDASGNLGVGTTSPLSRFTVQADASANAINIIGRSAGQNEGWLFWYKNGGTTLNAGINGDNEALKFATGSSNTERARITSGGYFKASNDGTYIDAAGTYHELRSNANSNVLYASNSIASGYTSSILRANFSGYTPNAATSWFLYCDDTTNQKAGILSTGTFESRTSTYGGVSDIKLKQDIVDAASQWNDIKAVRVRNFRFKDEPDAPMLGVVAQELEAVSPGLVYETPDYENVDVTDEDGNVTTERQATGTVTKSVKYSVLYMKAVGALQEAMARIEALEARLEALEA